MQTPGAEGAKWAFFKVEPRVLRSERRERALRRAPKAFVHDGQVLIQVSADPDLGGAQMREVQRIMETNSGSCRNVKVGTEAAIDDSGDKAAEPRADEEGRFVSWTPEPSVLLSTSAAVPAANPHTVS